MYSLHSMYSILYCTIDGIEVGFLYIVVQSNFLLLYYLEILEVGVQLGKQEITACTFFTHSKLYKSAHPSFSLLRVYTCEFVCI